MTITEMIAWGIFGLMAVASIREAIDFWLYGVISDKIKSWLNE